jgi:recombination protein RecR
MNSIQKLTEYFSEFPSIGARQARRFVYYLLTRNPAFLNELSDLIRDLKKNIHECITCHQFFQQTQGNTKECEICRSPQRENKTLMIVSRDVDLHNIEKTHTYNGKYFILGGSIPILEKSPDTRIRTKELLSLVSQRVEKRELEEIILAMNLTPEGDNTGEYIESILKSAITSQNIKISHLGKGISTGTEIEYSDSETIKNALKNRQ